MELDKVINDRKSIRKYLPTKISEKDILYILNNARLSPSAHNIQPWHYIVLTGDKKNELFKLISEYLTKKDLLTYYEKIMRKSIDFILEAPTIVIVYSSLEKNEINDYLSLGSSIEHICLSATNIGISSLWLGVIIEFEKIVNEFLNINNMKLISSVLLGYTKEEPNITQRKDLKDIVTFL